MSVYQDAVIRGFSEADAALLSSLAEHYSPEEIPTEFHPYSFRFVVPCDDGISAQFLHDVMMLFLGEPLSELHWFANELWVAGFRHLEEVEESFLELREARSWLDLQAIYETSHPSDATRALTYCFENPGLTVREFATAIAPAVERYKERWFALMVRVFVRRGTLVGDTGVFWEKFRYAELIGSESLLENEDTDSVLSILLRGQYPAHHVSPRITRQNVEQFVQFHSPLQSSKTEPVVHERLIELFQLDMPFPMIRRIARPVMLHPWESTQALADLLHSGVPASQVNRYLALQQFMGAEKLTAAHVRALVGAGQLNPALILTQGRGDGHVNVDAHEREWLSLDKYVAAL